MTTAGVPLTAAGGSARPGPATIGEAYRQGWQLVLRGVEWGWAKMPERAQAAVALFGILSLLFVASFSLTFILLELALLGLGLTIWGQRRATATPPRGRWARLVYPRREFAAALLRPTVLALVALMDQRLPNLPLVPGVVEGLTARIWPLSVAAVALMLWLVRHELGTQAEPVAEPDWWDHAELQRDIFHPTVLGPLWKDEGLPTIGYLGPPRHDYAEDGTLLGTTVLVRLPGISWTKLAAKHLDLAARMGVHRQYLTITGSPDRQHGEDVVRLWVGVPQAKRVERAVVPERTVWTDGVPFARTVLGKWVRLITEGVHTVLVGATGSGKTWCARWFVLHAVLDPSVDIVAIDGKDKPTEWRRMARRCMDVPGLGQGYVGGARLEACQQALKLLQWVEDEATRRNEDTDPRRLVLVVDEWPRLTKAAKRHDPALAKTLQSLLAELGAVARSSCIHIVMLSQRGVVTFLPGDLQASLTQRCVGKTVDDAEVGYVLDRQPQVLPTERGEMIVSEDGSEPVTGQVPMLTDEQWAEAVDRGTEMWLAELPVCAVPDKPQLAEQRAAVGVLPPHVLEAPAATLEGAVVALLRERGHSTSTELLDELPEALTKGMTREVLGRKLGAMKAVEKGWVGSTRGWRLTDGGDVHTLSDRQQNGTAARSTGAVQDSLKVLEVGSRER